MPTEAFQRELAELGFTEVLTRDWKPDVFIDTHTHDFEVRALMLAGELTLACGGVEKQLRAGDIFTLESGRPHSERYGPQGASYLVGRKRAA